MHQIIRFYCFYVALASATALLSASQQAPSPDLSKAQHAVSSSQEEMMAMPLVAPLFVENEQVSSFITVLNAPAAGVTADVILLDQHGIQITKKTVKLSGHSQQALKVGDLLQKAHSIATIGSVEIMPESKAAASMSVVAQLSIESTDPASPAHLEEEFLMPMPAGSNTFQAAAASVLGEPMLALVSTAKEQQSVTVNCIEEREAKGMRTRQMQLQAGQMVITSACESSHDAITSFEDGWNQETLGKRGAVGVSVVTTGGPGDLGVYGFALSGERDHPAYTALNFNDAGLVGSSNTVFAGVPVGHADPFPDATFIPEVAMVNFGTQPTIAKILYAKTDDTGVVPNTVESVTLPPYSSKSVTLSTLAGDSQMRNSFIVQSDAPAGSFAANLIANAGTQFGVVQLLGRDQKHHPNGGAHPWTIAGGMTSTLLLFNHSSEEQTFNVNISAGGILWQQQYKLAALQTKALTVNDLIASGAKDVKGRILPKDAKEGEVGWSVPKAPNGTGRLLVSRPDMSLARSFSCCTQDVPCGLELTAYALDLLIETGGTLAPAMAQYCTTCWPSCSDCTGYYDYTDDGGYPVSWNSSDSSIAPVDDYGNVTGQGPGSAQINATGDYGAYCMQAAGAANVASLSCSPSTVTRGSQVMCTIQGANGTNWQFSDGTNQSVNGPDGTSWTGTMVTSGTVTVTAKFNDGSTMQLSASVVVSARSWQLAMPSPQKVANGTSPLPTLSSPPDTSEGSLGRSAVLTLFRVNTSPSITSGPNTGYSYVTSLDTSGFKWIYELNPGIDNPNDDFAQHQYGACGIPSLSDIVNAVLAHENGAQNSHYAEASAQLASGNPGTSAEQSIGAPGTDPQTLANSVTGSVQQEFAAIASAAAAEPPTNLPGGINYPPYRTCP